MTYRATLQARILRQLLAAPTATLPLYLKETRAEDWAGGGDLEIADQAIRPTGPDTFDLGLLELQMGADRWQRLTALAVEAEPIEFPRLVMRQLRATTCRARMREAFAGLSSEDPSTLGNDLEALEALTASVRADLNMGEDDTGSIKPGIAEYIAQLEDPEKLPKARTGIGCLDNLLGGWTGGQLIVLAARPKCGKTLLAHQAIVETLRLGRSVVLFSLEMGKREVAGRLITNAVGPPDIARGDHFALEREAGRKLADLPLEVYTKPSKVSDVRAAVQRATDRAEVGLVVVDYLGLLRAPNAKMSEYERVTDASIALKGIAQEFDVPVLAVHQLNRVAADEEPRAHHLRSSGQIEADADQVILLWREDGDEDAPEPVVYARLELARSRAQGAKAELRARFSRMRFEEERALAERVL